MISPEDLEKAGKVLVPVAAALAEPLMSLILHGSDGDTPEAKAAYIRFTMAAKREALKKARGG